LILSRSFSATKNVNAFTDHLSISNFHIQSYLVIGIFAMPIVL
jgi:hypothetical protein